MHEELHGQRKLDEGMEASFEGTCKPWKVKEVDGCPWSRRWRKSMENVEEKMKCSEIWRIRERLLSEMENLVKMKSRSGAMVWKVARGDEGES